MNKKYFSTLLILFLLSLIINCQEYRLTNGTKIPNLTLPDTLGNIISLSEINKNKIVLLDFWASWCKPCRENNPKLSSILQRYKNTTIGNAQGFQIVSVSLDTKREDWINAIKKDNLTQANNLLDEKGFASSTPQIFQFEQIPSSYLIDENGIVIGVNLSLKQLDYEIKRRIQN